MKIDPDYLYFLVPTILLFLLLILYTLQSAPSKRKLAPPTALEDEAGSGSGSGNETGIKRRNKKIGRAE
ncbi:hypothetical protein DIPPA_28540 [Diplonema papillatum]|nr:hypothetical protein DIPPA_28540 [Diplonema papillatum]